MPVEHVTKGQALKAVRVKLPIKGDKALQQELDYAIGECSRCSPAGSLAEAFRMGAAAAQMTIAARVAAIKVKPKKGRNDPPTLAPHDPDCGTLMTFDEFVQSCGNGDFVDDDGFGELATKDGVSQRTISPSSVAHGRYRKPPWCTHVVWYNQ